MSNKNIELTPFSVEKGSRRDISQAVWKNVVFHGHSHMQTCNILSFLIKGHISVNITCTLKEVKEKRKTHQVGNFRQVDHCVDVIITLDKCEATFFA